jgi:hypothetical protein
MGNFQIPDLGRLSGRLIFRLGLRRVYNSGPVGIRI